MRKGNQKIKIFRNVEDFSWRAKEFPEQSKVLLITGLSGSGKSTLANGLAKKFDAIPFQVEWLIHAKHVSKECEPILNKFLEKNPEIVDNVKNKWNNTKSEDENELLRKYINEFLKYFLETKNPNKLYIIEGLQLFTLIDFDLIKDFPIIIKGTSSMNSLKNKIKRDVAKRETFFAKTKCFFKALRLSRIYQFKHRKILNRFIEKINKA